MAQNFVGSNNLNLLEPSGQFGTRLVGGTDAASPRYIFTHLAPVARLLFPEDDDALLTYREDDGQLIEPEFYAPVIPLLVINGTQGMAFSRMLQRLAYCSRRSVTSSHSCLLMPCCRYWDGLEYINSRAQSHRCPQLHSGQARQ